jgi:hypothetical protein
VNRCILGIVAIVVLVSTAGCAGFLGSGDGGDGGSGDATETTESTTSLEEVAYPNGATQDGFDNASAVMESHQEALSETNYALELDQTVVEGNQTSEYAITVRSNNESQRMIATTEQSLDSPDQSQEFRNEVYQNATHQHTNNTINGESTVRVQESMTAFGQSHESQTNARLVQSLIQFGNYSATDIVERDGTTLIQYEMTEYNASSDGSFEPDDASGTILISEAGVVHEMQLSAEGTSDGTDVSIDLQFEVSETGDVTVEQPTWAEDA